jgi:hypothetical protein
MLVRYGGFAAASRARNAKDQAVKNKDVKDQAELPKMREIDPQSEPRLTEALRRMAAASPQSAPPELGAGLLGKFRRHHTRRRRVRRLGIAGLVSCLALAISLVVLHKSPPQHSQIASLPGAATGVPEKQASASPVPITAAPPRATVNTPRQVSSQAKGAKPQATSAGRAFLALPGYDPAVPTDELHVVRVQLPASALWRVGAPVGADAGSRRMTADFVVSQDGTPFAVRLVQ